MQVLCIFLSLFAHPQSVKALTSNMYQKPALFKKKKKKKPALNKKKPLAQLS